MFGRSLPTFNLKGDDMVKTYFGGLMTVCIVFVMIAYATIKFSHLIDKHNPNLAQYTEKNIYDLNDVINLNDINFRFAFTVEGYLDREMKADPAYVKYLVRIFGIKDGIEYQEFIPYHRCTDDDWAQFYPPADSARDGWETIRDDPKRGFFCLDWSTNIELYGNERNLQY